MQTGQQGGNKNKRTSLHSTSEFKTWAKSASLRSIVCVCLYMIVQAGMMYGEAHDYSISKGTDGIQSQSKETRHCSRLLARSDESKEKGV